MTAKQLIRKRKLNERKFTPLHSRVERNYTCPVVTFLKHPSTRIISHRPRLLVKKIAFTTCHTLISPRKFILIKGFASSQVNSNGIRMDKYQHLFLCMCAYLIMKRYSPECIRPGSVNIAS